MRYRTVDRRLYLFSDKDLHSRPKYPGFEQPHWISRSSERLVSRSGHQNPLLVNWWCPFWKNGFQKAASRPTVSDGRFGEGSSESRLTRMCLLTPFTEKAPMTPIAASLNSGTDC